METPRKPASAEPVTSSSWGSSSAASHGRFLPGAVLADRYRIIGLLGKGGMGEVYRADDLKLGQPVALKFLPGALDENDIRLQRFFNEVRTARQVTHPNVCRVYDLGELDGEHFLSMEYVDGEDLASLLRRIGRLPEEKAVQIARQICAGLAAAHEQGILHRDLKPANVMIDGRGRVRITDFGLAGLAQEIHEADVRSGTPAYMAPEQLAGKEVSARSDIYSLGLVLYEIFTGKTAFQANSVAELLRLQQETTPTNPSSHVQGFDPAVERVILRCLEPEPARRPASALTVAAALPGGDPLAAALAAGETPSPEMVAEAGDAGGLRPAAAIAFLATLLLGLLAVGLLRPHTNLIGLTPMEKSPEVLADRAREIAVDLGYDEKPVDTAIGTWFNGGFYRHIGEQDDPDRWEAFRAGRPPVFGLWYRSSPRLMVPTNRSARVTLVDPRPAISGMVTVEVDSMGRLSLFRAIPPQVAGPAEEAPEPDWGALFAAADLDMDTFVRADPEWVPYDYADRRAAWTGPIPEDPELTVRVEAAAFRGKPVFFTIVEPWTRPSRIQAREVAGRERAAAIIVGVIFTVMMVALLFFLRRNLLGGRGDRKGAFRLALFLIFAELIVWACAASHVPELNPELGLFVTALVRSIGVGGIAWVIYIALEPYVRRLWPDALIGWNRLLQGRLRDPMVGRDVLAGGSLAAVSSVVFTVHYLVPAWLGMPPHSPGGFNTDTVLGVRLQLSVVLDYLTWSILLPMIVLAGLQLLRVLLRRQWLAVAALFAITVVASGIDFDHFWVDGILNMVTWGLALFVLLRYGLLALIAYHFFRRMIGTFVQTTDFSTWYGQPALVACLLLLALGGYAFYLSLAGRPVFGGLKELES
ncbi:MAG: serine/threonine-protein kinase [Acidobacteriota bacterium]|jgi:serine/threonine-protein kinase